MDLQRSVGNWILTPLKALGSSPLFTVPPAVSGANGSSSMCTLVQISGQPGIPFQLVRIGVYATRQATGDSDDCLLAAIVNCWLRMTIG